MTAPAISIWISTRNAAAFIAKCLASLRSQTVTDWEAVFIDDASTDATWERALVAIDDDLRIRPIRNTERVRQVGAFIQAMPLLRGPITLELDGDDWLCRADALAQILSCYASKPDVDATSGRHSTTLGTTSPPWIGTRSARMLYLVASMCAPRSWRSDLMRRALAEMPDMLIDPVTGAPWAYAGDLALFAPVLYHARAIVSTVDPVYEINMANPESDWIVAPQGQRDCANRLIEMWRQRNIDISAEQAS